MSVLWFALSDCEDQSGLFIDHRNTSCVTGENLSSWSKLGEGTLSPLQLPDKHASVLTYYCAENGLTAENGGLLKTENILVINLLIENKVCRSFKYGRFQVRLFCGRQWCHTYGSTRYSGKWTPRSAYQKGAASPQTGKVSLQNLDQESRSLVVT